MSSLKGRGPDYNLASAFLWRTDPTFGARSGLYFGHAMRAMRAAGEVPAREFYNLELAEDAAEAALDATGRSALREDEVKAQSSLLRCIFGNPFRPMTIDPAWLTWNDGTVVKLAQAIYEERAFERMPILADALEDASCGDEQILTHCRGPGPHARGCFAVDALLQKE